jgi:hypothetical protein
MLWSFHVLVIYLSFLSKMITKKETSACASNDTSLELTNKDQQENKCKPQASRVALHPKEER